MRGAVFIRLSGLALALMVAACTAAPPPAAAKGLPGAADDEKFTRFIKAFRNDALRAGIAPATYDRAMSGIARIPRISELNLNQPEFVKPVWEYLDSAVSNRRISDGTAKLSEQTTALAAIEARFGVPKEILVSIWGNESDYGRVMGRYNIFAALATLAYDGPRAEYAKPQLIAALKMMQQQRVAAGDMTSSWAGAFGQTQFVPTTFLSKAVDGDFDGRIDLWRSAPDALASAANLLALAGWQKGQPWGFEVRLPKGFAYQTADLDTEMPASAWAARGVTKISGARIDGDAPASIYLPAGSHGPAIMVFANFKAVLKYNNAASYALAVCLLADRLKGGTGIVASWPRDDLPLNRAERLALQDSLNRLGYDIGKVDGVVGAKTRAAIRQYQLARGLPADGYATVDLLTRIAMDAKRK